MAFRFFVCPRTAAKRRRRIPHDIEAKIAAGHERALRRLGITVDIREGAG